MLLSKIILKQNLIKKSLAEIKGNQTTMQGIIYDSPRTTLKEDLFGWDPIVNRISEVIKLNSKGDHNCYTIGIYGKWGEGKTSLMNMVCDSLAKEEKIKIIHFNPWLFKDQESLLLDFFQALQNENISKKFVEKIKQYGPLVSLGLSALINIALPGLGTIVKGSLNESIEAIPKIDIDIRKIKKEVNSSIKESKKHLLIVIDDVDRLDKDELHALFKLIRQNADFVNTTYMIAMDVDMVAKSIGQRFESGDEQSGKNFLEKIIQVPIYLPKIQRGHLGKLFNAYLFPQIEAILSESGKSTTSLEEVKESFYQYGFPLFRTVREVILYINSLTISLPLVYRNVNISDLCLLEALKIFHPNGYSLINRNKLYITGSEFQISIKASLESAEIRQKKKDQFIESLLKNVDSDKLVYIEEIIHKILYPFISSHNNNTINLTNEKSLCSSVYFDNYFLYTTPDDIISDVEYDHLIEEISTMEQDELTERFEFYYQKYGYSELTRVVYQMLYKKYFYNINNDNIGLICIALSRLSVNKIRKQYTEPEIGIHVEFTICDIVDRYVVNLDKKTSGGSVISDYKKKVEILQTIFSEQVLLPFHLFLATHMCDKCSLYYAEKERVKKLVFDLISRYIAQNGLNSLFKLGQTPTTVLFGIWKEVDPKDYREQVDKYIASEEFDTVSFIQKMIYNSDKSYYDRFCGLFDADVVYDKVKDIDSKEIPNFSHTIGYFIRMHKSRIAQVENVPT